MTGTGVALIGLLLVLAALGLLFGIYYWEQAQQRREEHNQRTRLMNEAIQQDIAAQSRKHNAMREMRRIARDYRS